MNTNLDKAEELAQKGLELARKQRHVKSEAKTIDTLGWIYYKRGMYEQALRLLEEARHKDGEELEFEKHFQICREVHEHETSA